MMPNTQEATTVSRPLTSDSPFASIKARDLAVKHNLRDLKGSGRNGKITLADVRAAFTTFTRSRAREAGSSLSEAAKKRGADKDLLPKWADVFIAALTKDPNVGRAAAVAGISRMRAYQVKKESQLFSELWEEAIEIGTDDLASEARRRALEGVEDPIYYDGIKVGTRRKYSDKLMILLLRAHRPEVYAEHSILEGTFKHDVPGRIVQPSDEGERRLAALVERLACHPTEGFRGR